MTSNLTHPQFSETDLDSLKIEFSQLSTIKEKFLFWERKFKISYAFWGRILINGYYGNFEIIPSGIEETQTLIKLILEDAIPVFWKRQDLRINDMKEQFKQRIESAPNKLVVIDYEIKKIDDLVLPKRQTNMYEDTDKYEKDLYFVRGFENYLIFKKEFESYGHLLAGYLLVEYYKGIQLAKYREFVETYTKQERTKPEIKLSGEQKVLALIYLGFGSNTTTAVQKADLFEYFIDNFKSKSIQKILNRLTDYEDEKNLDALIDFFRSLKLGSIARLLEDKLEKLKQK